MKVIKNVKIKDCGEKLVSLDPKDFVLEPIYYKWGYSNTDKIKLREGMIERLKKAQAALQGLKECEGWKLKIWDCYRTLKTQKILYDNYYSELKEKHPEWNDDKIKKNVEIFVSRPSRDPENPSPHNTGGVVDLTLVDENGMEVSMGTPFDEFTERSFTDHFKNSTNTKDILFHKNRMILKDVMEEAGFINYYEEWWHYSYGDQEWVLNAGADFAIYGSMEL